MEEGLANFYYDKLKAGESPIPILVKTLIAVTGVRFDNKYYGMIGRLNKIYGTEIVFRNILKIGLIDDLGKYNIYGLLRNSCIKSWEDKNEDIPVLDLSKLANENLKDLGRNKKLSIPEIGGLDDD